jgi:regulator of cell morphogenesis and NO signaling
MNALQNSTIGQLARDIPGATAVFREYGLDFCCGGDQRLIDAANLAGLDGAALIKQLEALQAISEQNDHWATSSVPELIEHILFSCHDQHRQQLPELIRLAQRVELVHESSPECPAGLSSFLKDLASTLDAHMNKEEKILFPMLSQGVKAGAAKNIDLMKDEHMAFGSALKQLNKLTNNITPPPKACNTWRALYTGLNKLQADVVAHIHLENNILFNKVL